MNRKLSHVAAAVFGRPWFIREDYLRGMGRIVEYHLSGGRLEPLEIQERLDAAAATNGPRRGARAVGSVAVIPIYGMIAPRATLMSDMSGGTSVEAIRQNFRSAMGDESVGSILFDVDSPGGYTDGIEELATEIRNARGTKPMVAIANYGMASAALYLGAQADELVASPSSMVGWIGTALIHTEYSKMDEMAGITTTIFRDPPGKLGANEHEPLSEKASQELQQEVEDFSVQFINAVAKGRGVSVATVKSDFGQGGGMTAERAKAAGLVDRVDTIDGTIQRLATGKVQMKASGARAAAAGYRTVSIENSETIEESLGISVSADDALATEDSAVAPDPLDELSLEQAIAARSRRRRDR